MVSYGFTWSKNKDAVLDRMEKYFGVSAEMVDDAFYKKSYTEQDKRNLVAVMYALNNSLPYAKVFADPTLKDEDRLLRRKSVDAILSNPKFSETDPNFIYYRLGNLFDSMTSKGIDIFQTIYITSLTDGNLKVNFDKEKFEVVSRDKFADRDFENIYEALCDVLDLKGSDGKKIANSVFEKCAATMLSKVYASNIRNNYQEILKFQLFNPENNTMYYLYGYDPQYVNKKREYQKCHEIKEGLINCPTIFSCKPKKIADAYSYLVSKVSDELIEKHYQKAQLEGKTNITKFYCKYSILKQWIDNKFSLLTINAKKMRKKEEYLANVEQFINNKLLQRGITKGFNFTKLFQNPTDISIMNSIPVEKIEANAFKNVITLMSFGKISVVQRYIENNPYILSVNNENLVSLLNTITDYDKEHEEGVLRGRFFSLGKSLFANKHYIDFNDKLVFNKLAEIEDISILPLDEMSDWEKLEKFIELFFNNDKSFEAQLVHYMVLKQDNDNYCGKILRGRIRDAVGKFGGWDKIIKNRDKILALTQEVSEINSMRFKVENVEKTGIYCNDIRAVQNKELELSESIKSVMASMRKAYSVKRDRLNKRFSDVDALYEQTMNYLIETAFTDIEPISYLLDSELRVPLLENIEKNFDVIDRQNTMFGSEMIEFGVPAHLARPLRNLYTSIAIDEGVKKQADSKDSNIIKITAYKDKNK